MLMSWVTSSGWGSQSPGGYWKAKGGRAGGRGGGLTGAPLAGSEKTTTTKGGRETGRARVEWATATPPPRAPLRSFQTRKGLCNKMAMCNRNTTRKKKKRASERARVTRPSATTQRAAHQTRPGLLGRAGREAAATMTGAEFPLGGGGGARQTQAGLERSLTAQGNQRGFLHAALTFNYGSCHLGDLLNSLPFPIFSPSSFLCVHTHTHPYPVTALCVCFYCVFCRGKWSTAGNTKQKQAGGLHLLKVLS